MMLDLTRPKRWPGFEKRRGSVLARLLKINAMQYFQATA